MRRFELEDGRSAKFWEIELEGASFTVRFGRMGSAGQAKTKSFASADAARRAHDALVREKMGKGYREVGGAAGSRDAAREPKRDTKTKKPVTRAKTKKAATRAKTEKAATRAKTKTAATRAKSRRAKRATPERSESSSASATIAAIEEWMREHDAALLVENLAPGCDEPALDRAAAALGARLSPALEELYRIHDGQLEEMNCFIEWLNFFGVDGALRERERVLRLYVRSTYGVLGYADYRTEWSSTPLFEEEVGEAWWPLAGMDSDYLIVSLATGRVFWAQKDVPPLRLAANDVDAFFAQYLQRMRRGEYRVEEGFGDCYLATDTAWVVERPRLPSWRPAESPREIVSRVFEAVMGSSLIFQLEEMTATKKAVRVILAFNRPDAWDARVREHPVVTRPLEALTEALARELPKHARTIELLPIDTSTRSFAIALRNAGPEGEELAKRLPPT